MVVLTAKSTPKKSEPFLLVCHFLLTDMKGEGLHNKVIKCKRSGRGSKKIYHFARNVLFEGSLREIFELSSPTSSIFKESLQKHWFLRVETTIFSDY